MTALAWDEVGSRFFEAGVDRGVLFIPDEFGAYVDGVAWSGLITVTEKPTGAAPNAKYADNIKYLNLYSTEQFDAEIDAYTYPDEFQQFDGLVLPSPGVAVGQQTRKRFGLCYRTRVGNDLAGDDYGYKLHLVYGCTASPSDKAYGTINESPDGIAFKWMLSTQPVSVNGLKPTALVTVDSTKVDATRLGDLEQILYGTEGVQPSLPLPDTVIGMFAGSITTVTPTQPAFNQGTNTITIPTVAGVTYYVDGVAQTAGAHVITHDTLVTARPNPGYIFPTTVDNDWEFTHV